MSDRLPHNIFTACVFLTSQMWFCTSYLIKSMDGNAEWGVFALKSAWALSACSWLLWIAPAFFSKKEGAGQ